MARDLEGSSLAGHPERAGDAQGAAC